MIELFDSAENIFNRLVFSDENDNIYKDDEYKNKHRDYYLNDIQKDLEWYGYLYSKIEHKFDMNGMDSVHVTDELIKKYQLNSLIGV